MQLTKIPVSYEYRYRLWGLDQGLCSTWSYWEMGINCFHRSFIMHLICLPHFIRGYNMISVFVILLSIFALTPAHSHSFPHSLPLIPALTPTHSRTHSRSLPLTSMPIHAHSRAYPCSLPLTPAHSRSLPLGLWLYTGLPVLYIGCVVSLHYILVFLAPKASIGLIGFISRSHIVVEASAIKATGRSTASILVNLFIFSIIM